jgi:prolycopene isomerase
MTGKLLAELGVETGWIKMDPVDTFHFPDGSRFEVPADFETYRAKLDAEFPHQKASLDRFFNAVRQTYLLGLLCYFKSRDASRLGDWRDMTMRDALDLYLTDPKLKLLLTADCPHWGSPPKRTSFVFDSMLRLSYFLGNYYPKGGSQAFADELAYRFERSGGHILISSRVEKILVRNDRVCGVRLVTTRGPLQGVRRVSAGFVISNADLRHTYLKLLGERHVAPELRQEIEALRPTFPCYLCHIGLRGVSDEQLEAAQGYYWNEWDPDRVGTDGLRCKIFAPTLYEPAMAPPGGQIVIIQKVLDMDYHSVGSWAEHKAALEAYVLCHLRRVIPGVERKIVVTTSASARTSWRFTLNQAGAMLGWEMSPDQLGDGRPSIHGPVENLYLTGHWTRPGGGITPVIISAVHVAEAVLGKLPATRQRDGLVAGRRAVSGES